MTSLLRVRDLEIGFPESAGSGVVRAVDGVSFELDDGEVMAIAGESGAGKTTLGRAVLGLLPPGAEVSGKVEVAGVELISTPERRRRPLRGRVVAWIPQTPRSALHPTLTVARQLEETIRACRRDGGRRIGRRRVRREASGWLERVGLESSGGAFSHELSGGMRQRASIALALAGRPRLLVADEPTTALDSDLVVGFRKLLLGLIGELGLALLWIGHDLQQIASLNGSLAIMYRGRWIERGPARALLRRPAHPYTEGLVRCGSPPSDGRPWPTLPAPRSGDEGTGCVYWSRCPRRDDARCRTERPPLRPVVGREPGHLAATWCEPSPPESGGEILPDDGRDPPPDRPLDGRFR